MTRLGLQVAAVEKNLVQRGDFLKWDNIRLNYQNSFFAYINKLLAGVFIMRRGE